VKVFHWRIPTGRSHLLLGYNTTRSTKKGEYAKQAW